MKILILHKSHLTISVANTYYIKPLEKLGIKDIEWDIQATHNEPKLKIVEKRQWLDYIKDSLNSYDYILVSDSDYFKLMTKQSSVDKSIGSIYNTEVCNTKVISIPPIQLNYTNEVKFKERIEATNKALLSDIEGTYSNTGSIILEAKYPSTVDEITQALASLMEYPQLTLDIETRSLRVSKAGIYTIGFGIDQNRGVAFTVDANPEPVKIRELLKEFLINYKGKFIVHKANYDLPVLIYNLWMKEDFTNLKEQVEGINILCDKTEDTLLITYLATNSCGGTTLDLKSLAAEYAKDWAVDVKDVTTVDINELLEYNLIDVLSTWYVFNKYYPRMVKEAQLDIYEKHFKVYLKDCIRMQLNGLPINIAKVKELEATLLNQKAELVSSLTGSQFVKDTELLLSQKATDKRNATLKKKVTTLEDNLVVFNTGSSKHLATLLYEVMKLPIIDRTPSGLPSTDSDTINKFFNYNIELDKLDLVNTIIDFNGFNKIITGFIPAFLNSDVDTKGNVRLCGYFNLGGTVSGRMSSNNPNLQNLPASGSRYAKAVKECFTAPKGWLMVGIDFQSLEDKIDALKTRDENKIKVYTDGYDGHSLRAYYYFKNKMPDIEDTVESINSIKDKYPEYRQMSKAPTFALTYQGTAHTLVKNCGFSMETASAIETSYHTLYKQSDDWLQVKLEEAGVNGYITAAFGLKVRTPLLKLNKSNLRSLQAAEKRTAGNALGQSWGLLNNRAMSGVMRRVDLAGLTDSIYPIAAIHDACYYMIKADTNLVLWFNKVVTQEAKWQNDPVIEHKEVKLSGELDIFFPSWANKITLPEHLTKKQLITLFTKHKESLKNDNS